MGKKSKYNLRNIQEIENNPAMPDRQRVNNQSTSKLMETKKKTVRDVDPTITKKTKVAHQENGTQEPSLQSLRKPRKKRRKKMGHPIIVEDSMEEFPTIPLPLRHKLPQDPTITSVSLNSLNFDLRKRKIESKGAKKIRVMTAECIKPSSETKKHPERFAGSEDTGEPMAIENPAVVLDEEPGASSRTKKLVSNKNREFPSGERRDKHENSSVLVEESRPAANTNGENNTQELPRFYSFRNKVLAIMRADSKFCFHGKLKIRVLYGAIRIYGYSRKEAQTESALFVYSPRAYSPLAIEAIDGETTEKNVSKIWENLEELCNDSKFASRLRSDVEAVEEGWAILMLENFDNRLTNYLSENFPHRLFPRIDDPSNHSWLDPRRAEIILQANLRLDDFYQKIVIDSRGIDDVADAISYDWENKKNSRTIIAGGKGVGKSTAARYVVNKLLGASESVVFLDLDPGQPEFTPAGCLSLNIVEEPILGPSFTHVRAPYFQVYIGGPDINRCLTHYINGVKRLVDRLNEDSRLHNRPVVVNTMGYCKGIGRDIMSYVIKILSPTDVIQILSRRSKNNYDDTLTRQVIDRQGHSWINCKGQTDNRTEKPARHRLHVIYSEAETSTGPAESWNLEPHQQRELVMVSYLSEIVRINGPIIRGLSSSINATPPYAIPFGAVSVSLNETFIPQILSVMNGNIVALCGVDSESTETSNSGEPKRVSYPEVLARPPLSTCYGFGILRGVDMEKEQLFVNTPLSPAVLEHVNCLVGRTNVPQCLLQLDQRGAPYTGNEFDLPTSRGPRRGYVRTRYQPET